MGVTFLFQAEIRPDMHGCNELRFNITADSIQAIFKTYPAGITHYEVHHINDPFLMFQC